MSKSVKAKKKLLLGLALALIIPSVYPTFAGEVDVVDVKARQTGSSWSFDVTVLHDDAGWDHYADKWDIFGPNGEVLGTRVLAHPHDNEQPFTRSLSGVEIPDSVKTITVRAHDSVHEYGGKEMTIELPR